MKPFEYLKRIPAKSSFSLLAGAIFMTLLGFSEVLRADDPKQAERPNILFIIADDMSWPHAGAYGDRVVKTPSIDRLAREGVLFNYAYSASASCTISRNAILTGQQPWRLGEGAVFGATLSQEFAVFPLLLEAAGYDIAWTGKSWGPGDLHAGGWGSRHPAGRVILPHGTHPENFARYLADRPRDRPFFFWFGSSDPHRSYKARSGVKSGKKIEDVTVPAFWPDVPEVRHDILDYYVMVERFDRHVGQLIETLRQSGLLDKTLVIVTSDHGMPFPRCKADCYDMSNHVPLAIRWPEKISAGRTVDDFVSLTDIGPTVLEAAGAAVPAAMTGHSLMGLLKSEKSGLIDPSRDFIVTSFERHSVGRPNWATYPIRAIRTHRHMYLRNLEPGRWPNCDPYFPGKRPHPHLGAKFMDIDSSPTKQYFLDHSEQPGLAPFYKLCLAKRPGEELYDMHADPWQVRNLASQPSSTAIKHKLRQRLDSYLHETGDPRASGENPFDYYPYRYAQKDKPLQPRRPEAKPPGGK